MEQVQTTKSRTRQWHDPFEDNIKEALALVPATFFIAPTPDPLHETLTPPTSDGSEHDRSHSLNPDIIDKDLQILTPDHEIEPEPEKLDLEEKPPQNDSLEGFDSDLLEDPETPEKAMIEAGIDIVMEEEARTQAQESLEQQSSSALNSQSSEMSCDETRSVSAPPVQQNSPEPLQTNSEFDESSQNLDIQDQPDSPDNQEVSSNIRVSPVLTRESTPELLEPFQKEKELSPKPQLLPANSGESSLNPRVSPARLQDSPVKAQESSTFPEKILEPPVNKIKLVITMGGLKEPVETSAMVVPVVSEAATEEELHMSDIPVSPSKGSPSKSLGDLDLELDLDDESMIIDSYDVPRKRDSLGAIDDPELDCDFINDKSCEIKLEKQAEEPAFPVKTTEETPSEIPSDTVTKLAVSDDISLNIMSEIKVDLKIPEPKPKLVEPLPPPLVRQNGVEPPNPLCAYNSPSASSSTSSSPRTDSERKEKLTLRIPRKDLVLPSELGPKKQKKKKSKQNYYFSDQGGSGQLPNYLRGGYSPDMYGMYSEEENETDMRRISLQQQLLAEKGITTSSIPVEQTQNLVKNMREKQQTQALPKLTKAPLEHHQPMLESASLRPQPHKSIPVVKDSALKPPKAPSRLPPPYSRSDSSESIRSALKAKINQRRYTDMPSPPAQYPHQSSGNHCCYVVKGSPGECVCSTAPMLFCTKCYHLSHSTCSNILCSNCGALFKFN